MLKASRLGANAAAVIVTHSQKTVIVRAYLRPILLI